MDTSLELLRPLPSSGSADAQRRCWGRRGFRSPSPPAIAFSLIQGTRIDRQAYESVQKFRHQLPDSLLNASDLANSGHTGALTRTLFFQASVALALAGWTRTHRPWHQKVCGQQPAPQCRQRYIAAGATLIQPEPSQDDSPWLPASMLRLYQVRCSGLVMISRCMADCNQAASCDAMDHMYS